MFQRGFAHILILVLLLIGIVVGFYIVNFTITQLSPKAAYFSAVEFTDSSGKSLGKETKERDVYLVIRLRDGWKLEEETGSLVSTTFAQSALPSPIATSSAQPVPSFRPRGGVLRSLTIENNDMVRDSEGNITDKKIDLGGSTKLLITNNFNQYLNRPIPWKLNDLSPDQHDVTRTVAVTLSSALDKNDTNATTHTIFMSIILVKEPLKLGSEIPVDVIFYEDIENFSQAREQVKNMINIYVNSKLKESGVNRQFRFNNAYIENVDPDCENSAHQPSSVNYPIRVYIPKNEDRSRAYTADNRICLQRNIYTDYTKKVLLHELSHLLGLADYYNQNVSKGDNHVAKIGIRPEVQDLMWDEENDFFSTTSREIINKLDKPLPGIFNYWLYYTPKNVVLQILDDSGTPLSGVTIEVFPGSVIFNDKGLVAYQYIQNKVSFTEITDFEGKVSLGGVENIFEHHSPINNDQSGESALLRLTYNGETRFAALTVSHLNYLYFDKGQTDIAIISEPFSKFALPAPDGTGITIKSFNMTTTDELTPQEENELQQHLYLHKTTF